MYRSGLGIAAVLSGLLCVLAPARAEAIQQWYNMFHCTPEDHLWTSGYGLVDEYSTNQYGYHNLSSNNELYLVCAQPHLSGASGYSSAVAKVFDRNTSSDVYVELCRNDGMGSQLCDTQSTSSWAAGVQTLNFGSNSDASRSFYYWKVTIPTLDASHGASHLVSLFFTDN